MTVKSFYFAKRIVVLMTDGFEQVEFTGMRAFLMAHGAMLTIVWPKANQVQSMYHKDVGDAFDVDLTVAEAQARDSDALLLLPGRVANPDELCIDSASAAFVKGQTDCGHLNYSRHEQVRLRLFLDKRFHEHLSRSGLPM